MVFSFRWKWQAFLALVALSVCSCAQEPSQLIEMFGELEFDSDNHAQ
jgi:hypothetical protein